MNDVSYFTQAMSRAHGFNEITDTKRKENCSIFFSRLSGHSIPYK